MKKILLFLSISLFALLRPGWVLGQEEVIAYWNFNNAATEAPIWPQPILANQGSGEITYDFAEVNVISFAGSTVNALNGDVAGGSLSFQDSVNNGRHFTVSFATTGLEKIRMTYATRGTGTGFSTHTLFYSTNGIDFDSLGQIGGRNVTTFSLQEFNLDTISTVDNVSDVYLRIVLDGASSAAGNNRIDNIQILGTPISAETKVANVVFSPTPKAYLANSVEISLSSSTSGASIYYTLDGSDPDETSNLYTAPFSITESTTVKAIAKKSGLDDADITSGSYTLFSPANIETIQSARSKANGEYSLITGVVTARGYGLPGNTNLSNPPTNVWIQDDSGFGIIIRAFANSTENNGDYLESAEMQLGDSVLVYAPKGTFNTNIQLVSTTTNKATILKLKSDGVSPEPLIQDLIAFSSFDNQGRLVTVENVNFLTTGNFTGNTNYFISDGNDTIIFRMNNGNPIIGNPIPERKVKITGIVDIFSGNNQLLTNILSNIEEEPEVISTEPKITSLSPANGAINVAITTGLSIVFDQDVLANTDSLSIVRSNDDVVVARFAADSSVIDISGNTLSVTLNESLGFDTGYYILIDSGFVKNAGEEAFLGILDATTWAFSTEPAPSSDPTILVTGSFAPFAATNKTASDIQSVSIRGSNLNGSITAMAGIPYQASFDPDDFSKNEITGLTGILNDTTIYIKLDPTVLAQEQVAQVVDRKVSFLLNLVPSDPSTIDIIEEIELNGTISASPGSFYPLATQNLFVDFSDIATWNNNFVGGGLNAGYFRRAASTDGSTVNGANVFASGTSGGVQKGSESIVLLATGTNSSAFDLLINATDRIPTSFSFDWEKVANTANANPRSSTLIVQYSTDNGVSFQELPAFDKVRVLNTSNPEVGKSNYYFPVELAGVDSLVLRFFASNDGDLSGAGNRPKIAIDNITIESIAFSGTLPNLAVLADTLRFGEVFTTENAVLSYTLDGEDFTFDQLLTVSGANSGLFSLSLNESGPFVDTLQINSGVLNGNVEVFVRFDANEGANGNYTANILHLGFPTKNIVLKGTEVGNALPPAIQAPFVENFNAGIPDSWVAFSVEGAQNWRSTTFGFTGGGVEINGFAGGAQLNEDWLISPLFEKAGILNVLFQLERRFDGPGLKVFISDDYSGFGNPSSATWKDLNFTNPAPASTDGVWERFQLDLTSETDGDYFLAFVYYSSPAEGASRFRLDDFTLANQAIEIAPASLNFGLTATNGKSEIQGVAVTASNLIGNLNIAVTGAFEISLDSISFSKTLELDPAGSPIDTVVLVRFSPELGIAGSRTGSLSFSNDPVSQSVSLSGIEDAPALTLPYTENFDAASSLANIGWTAFDVEGPQGWILNSPKARSGQAARMNGFPSSSQRNEDWLISPRFDLIATDFPVLEFFSRKDFGGGDIELLVSVDYDGASDPRGYTWSRLPFQLPSSVNTYFNSGLVDLFNFKSSDNVYIAFKYVSGPFPDQAAAEWLIDDLSVSNAAERPETAPYLFSSINALSDLYFGQVTAGNTSSAKSFTLTIGAIETDITLTAPDGFEIKKASSSEFEQSLTFTIAEIANVQELEIRFAPVEAKPYGGQIQISGGFEGGLGYFTGSAIEKSKTFDVVTWNIEWFGDVSNGPSNKDLQFNNVKAMMQDLDADIYALQEIVDLNRFYQLVSELDGYGGIHSPEASQGPDQFDGAQKVCFIFKLATVDTIATRPMLANIDPATLVDYPGGNPDRFWASGRFPFLMQVEVKYGEGEKRPLNLINIHARSNGGGESAGTPRYAMRKYDVEVLKDTLDAHFKNVPVLILGDYNDDLDETVADQNAPTVNTSETSFISYINDPFYAATTLTLSNAGLRSFIAFENVIDHIIVNSFEEENWFRGSERIVIPFTSNPTFQSTTSDHMPVMARFDLTPTVVSLTSSSIIVEEGQSGNIEIEVSRETRLEGNLFLELISNTGAEFGEEGRFQASSNLTDDKFTIAVNARAATIPTLQIIGRENNVLNENDTLRFRLVSDRYLIGQISEIEVILTDASENKAKIEFEEASRSVSQDAGSLEIRLEVDKTFDADQVIGLRAIGALEKITTSPAIGENGRFNVTLPAGQSFVTFTVNVLATSLADSTREVQFVFDNLPEKMEAGVVNSFILELTNTNTIAVSFAQTSINITEPTTVGNVQVNFSQAALVDGNISLGISANDVSLESLSFSPAVSSGNTIELPISTGATQATVSLSDINWEDITNSASLNFSITAVSSGLSFAETATLTVNLQASQDPGDDTEEPGDDEDENPGDDEGETPGDDEGEEPGDNEGEEPGDDEGENPGDDEGENPGDDEGEEPGDDEGENPGDDDDEEPGDDDDEEEPITPTSVSFASENLTISSESRSIMLALNVSGDATDNASLTVGVTVSGWTYGNEYTTLPAAQNGIITLAVSNGQVESLELLISESAGREADKEVRFTLVGVSTENYEIGSPATLTVIVEKIVVLGLEANGLRIYPNPSSNYLHIDSDKINLPGSEYELINMDGRSVRHGNLINDNLKGIDVSDLKTGTYLLKIKHSAGSSVFRIKVLR